MVELAIRPFRPSDYAVVRRWIDDPAAHGPFPQSVPMHTDDDVRRLVAGEQEPNIVRFAVEVMDRVVGEVQYRFGPHLLPSGAYEIGITIWDPGDRGHGFGKEAQWRLVDLLFREKRARRVQAGTDPRNVAERRCLESLGFMEEGVLRRLFPSPDGQGHIVMYGLLQEEWAAAPGTPRDGGRPAEPIQRTTERADTREQLRKATWI
jgi:RimJ/RimL family protein N-acetyltransferase